MTSPIGHFIEGRRAPGGTRSASVFDPATGSAQARVLLADRATVEAAIVAAERAYGAWYDTPPHKRARVMGRVKQLLEAHAERIGALITAEHGKVLHDAMGEVQRGIENVEYASYIPELLKGEHSRNVASRIDSWSEFQPLGVTAGI